MTRMIRHCFTTFVYIDALSPTSTAATMTAAQDRQDTKSACAANSLADLALTLACEPRDIARLNPAHFRSELRQDSTVLVGIVSQRWLSRVNAKQIKWVILHGVPLGWSQQRGSYSWGYGAHVSWV